MKRKRMTKSKGTSWKSEEDVLLIEILIEFVSKGASIHEGFVEAGKRIPGRSHKACYGRWVSYLKEIYGESIEQAKQKQKEYADQIVKSLLENQQGIEIHQAPAPIEIHVPTLQKVKQEPLRLVSNEMNSVLEFLMQYEERYLALEKEHAELLEELERSWKEVDELKQEVARFDKYRDRLPILEELITKLERVTVS